MRWTFAIAGLAATIGVSGCSTSAAPTFVDGNYYLIGDTGCAKYKPHKIEKKILCHNNKDKPTGIRHALTDQQLYMYQQNMMRQQIAEQQAASRIAAGKEMPVIKYPQMPTPQVMPIGRPGGNQIRCIQAGIYTNCRLY